METHMRAPGTRPPDVPAPGQPTPPPRPGTWLALLLGGDRRTRIRLQQWLIAAMTYIGSSAVLAIDHYFGWLGRNQLMLWVGFAVASQAIFYLALRSGLSTRSRDPALTVSQILVGLLFANWAYLMAGEGRAVALMPMLLLLVFGAFVLHWKKLAVLTTVALAGFGTSVVALQRLRWVHPGAAAQSDLNEDLLYLASLAILLPVAAFLAAQLSRLRSKLRAKSRALASALDEVQRLAEFDELTGLANRRNASHYLAAQHAKAQLDGSGFVVALIDLDNFKHINDTRGHDGGDRALQAFAAAARPLMRGTDLMARWGGEEFLIVMPATSAQGAYDATLRLLERVRTLSGESGSPLSFSAGIASYEAGEPVASTVARADRRMYIAKDAGRSQVCMTG
ncbi:MAG: GGDEF domain-containing protein [Rhodanobacter sp.]